MLVRSLAVGPGSNALRHLPELAHALTGAGPLLIPHATGAPPPVTVREAHGVPDDAAFAVATSGTTGTPRLAVLSAGALRASAQATHERLGGPGIWVLALPGHHIAGLQVLARSIAAGHAPVIVERRTGFAAAHLGSAARRARDQAPRARRYTSLVPTQLVRLLASPQGVAVLREFDAVLVGGAAISPAALSRARSLKVPIVATYGMSETCGGCVYDGVPLTGVTAGVHAGRITLSGPVVAHGYLGGNGRLSDGGVFTTTAGGRRAILTDDCGHIASPAGQPWHAGPDGEIDDSGQSRLVLDGRVDDVIITGGLKVRPDDVEAALEAVLPPGTQVAVTGLPDEEWGARVGAVVAPAFGARSSALIQLQAVLPHALAHARATLPAYAHPRRVLAVAEMPLRGPGKPDRAAVRTLLTS